MNRQGPTDGKHKRGKHRVAVVDRQVAAVRLRRNGCTYDEIAATLGYAGRGSAFKAVGAALHAVRSEEVDTYRALELARLDRLQEAVWDKAVHGNLRAVDTVLKIMARRASLLGLDAPVKREITGDIILRGFAERAALDAGLDPRLVLAEAERILAEVSD